MALVRILVDGYSLLHSCPELAPGRPPHSAGARDELIQTLTRYADATGTPVTVFFDGAGAPAGTPEAASSREVEVLYSKAGQTADDMIERAAHRFRPYGEVLVVTDDFAERDTVQSVGALTASCENFLRMMQSALTELDGSLRRHNRQERERFRKSRS